MTQRIPARQPPYEEKTAETLRRLMPPGMDPIGLFRTVAHNPAILDKMRSTGAYLLNFGTIDPREREIVLLRTTARCSSDYEWGVHVMFYADAVGLTPEQVASTARGTADDACWSARDALLVRLADELHESSTVGDDLWKQLEDTWTAEQLIELIAIAGQYHFVSYLTNALGVEREPGAPQLAG